MNITRRIMAAILSLGMLMSQLAIVPAAAMEEPDHHCEHVDLEHKAAAAEEVASADAIIAVEVETLPDCADCVVRYTRNNEIDLTGLQLRVHLTDGSSYVVGHEEVTLVSPQTFDVGVTDVQLQYRGFTLSFQIRAHQL